MTSLIIGKPEDSEYAPYYGRYIQLVQGEDIIKTLSSQIDNTVWFLRTIPDTKGDYRYAPDKWSIKEVVGHLIDTERVFAYRALSMARADKAALPGFEQDDWVRAARSGNQQLAELISEFECVRRSNLYFFQHLDEEAWMQRGTASGREFTVRAIAYTIAGHERHHFQILQTRYLS
jgi:Mycothiol maleylpyruvate isomerase N-terminal domain.